MTDEEIIRKIAFQAGIGAAFATAGKAFARSDNPRFQDEAQRFGNVAGLFIQHVLRLMATHRLVVERFTVAKQGERGI